MKNNNINLFEQQKFERIDSNASVLNLRKLKPQRQKRQKYSELEQLGFFAEYKAVFELIAYGHGGFCHQFYFRKYAESILKAKFKSKKKRKSKEELIANVDPYLSSDRVVQKRLHQIAKYNPDEARLKTATTRLVKKLIAAQLIEVKTIDKSNIIILLPKTKRLLKVTSSVGADWRSEKSRLKSALLGAYYSKAIDKYSIERLISRIKSGNMCYFDYTKHYKIAKRLLEIYKQNKWKYSYTNETGITQSPFLDIAKIEYERVKLIQENSALKPEEYKKLKKNESKPPDEEEKLSKSIYYIRPEKEDLTSLSMKNIFITNIQLIENKAVIDKDTDSKILNISVDIIDPSLLSTFELSKKIVLTLKALDQWLNVDYNTYAVFAIKIRTFKKITDNKDNEIKKHLKRFGVDSSLINKFKLGYSSYPDYKKSIYGNLVF